MKINEVVRTAHQHAREKGWWEKPKSPLEIHMLIVSEISEATEEVRAGNPSVYFDVDGASKTYNSGFYSLSMGGELLKPEGESIELADAVIRIMDYFGYKGWDLEQAIFAKLEYNKTRGHRHGGKLY